MFNLFKKKQPEPRIRYEYHTAQFDWFEDAAIKKYERNTDELDENDDFHMTKKEMKEEPYQEKFYKYEPTEFYCYLKGRLVYDIDDDLIGEIQERDMKYLEQYDQMWLVFHHGKYKHYDEDYDRVFIDNDFSYFDLSIKKRLS